MSKKPSLVLSQFGSIHLCYRTVWFHIMAVVSHRECGLRLLEVGTSLWMVQPSSSERVLVPAGSKLRFNAAGSGFLVLANGEKQWAQALLHYIVLRTAT